MRGRSSWRQERGGWRSKKEEGDETRDGAEIDSSQTSGGEQKTIL